jgi:rare lipoprotein A
MIESIIIAAACGATTFYGIGDGLHGNLTASGERFNAHGISAAHRTLPIGTRIRVTNRNNGRSVVVRVNDRGPYTDAILDLSYGAFNRIADTSKGRASICWQRVG